MTISIEHNLKFITEFDETHPVARQVLALDKFTQTQLLEGMLKNLLAPAIKPVIDEINANGSYAILKVAE
jgi:hypothetical protein